VAGGESLPRAVPAPPPVPWCPALLLEVSGTSPWVSETPARAAPPKTATSTPQALHPSLARGASEQDLELHLARLLLPGSERCLPHAALLSLPPLLTLLHVGEAQADGEAQGTGAALWVRHHRSKPTLAPQLCRARPSPPRPQITFPLRPEGPRAPSAAPQGGAGFALGGCAGHGARGWRRAETSWRRRDTGGGEGPVCPKASSGSSAEGAPGMRSGGAHAAPCGDGTHPTAAGEGPFPVASSAGGLCQRGHSGVVPAAREGPGTSSSRGWVRRGSGRHSWAPPPVPSWGSSCRDGDG